MKPDWLWDRNINAAKARQILRDPAGKEFVVLASLLLSRKNDPKEVFKRYLDPILFCREWSEIKKRMRKDRWSEPRIIFWQAIYEKLSDRYRKEGVVFRKKAPSAKDPILEETGRQIRGIRMDKGLSQKDFAKRMGVSQQLISRIEKGKENISLSTLNAISRAMERDIKISFM